MTHICLKWTPDPIEPTDVVEVEVVVGFNRTAPARLAGTLRLHASEANALDRMLGLGASFHQPAYTYEMVAREPLAAGGAGDTRALSRLTRMARAAESRR